MADKIREEDWLVESGRCVDELDELEAAAFGLVACLVSQIAVSVCW